MELQGYDLTSKWIRLKKKRYFVEVLANSANIILENLIILKKMNKVVILKITDTRISIFKSVQNVNKVHYRVVEGNIINLIIEYKSGEYFIMLEYYFSPTGVEYNLQPKMNTEEWADADKWGKEKENYNFFSFPILVRNIVKIMVNLTFRNKCIYNKCQIKREEMSLWAKIK